MEKEVIKFKEAYLNTKIENLKVLLDDFKKDINKCDIANIVGRAYSIGKYIEFFKQESQYLNSSQRCEIDNIEEEFSIQYYRLVSKKEFIMMKK